MTLQHTPGPWDADVPYIGGAEFDSNGNRYWEIKSREPHFNALHLYLTGWMTEKNAKLIAAAPDMAKLLAELIALDEQEDDGSIATIINDARLLLQKGGVQ